MSKVDAQRAMREAKYERNHAAAASRPAAAAPAAPARSVTEPAAPAPRPEPAPAAAAPTPAATGALCGHRSMNGRECTREAAHAEKSHRYG